MSTCCSLAAGPPPTLSQRLGLVLGEPHLHNISAKNIGTNKPNLQVGRLNNLLKDTHSAYYRNKQGV